jgi:hypothetical protein
MIEANTNSTITNSETGHTSQWDAACQMFLQAVAPADRKQVEALIHGMHNGGAGLREWISAIAWRGSIIPTEIPQVLIDVYLHDSEAVPLHDCEDCGIAIPVRPSRLDGPDGEPERVYFGSCPACGGRTGPFMYFSRNFQPDTLSTLRHRPR